MTQESQNTYPGVSISDAQSIWLFATKVPFVVPKELIYDPDIHGSYEDSGKIIPALRAIAVSLINIDSKGKAHYLYETVHHIDPETHKVTYGTGSWFSTESGETTDVTRILSYANDKWMLFFDDRVKPIKLYVDCKLPIAGAENVEYRLVVATSDGKKEVISCYLDNDDVFRGDRIPMSPIEGCPGIKLCSNSHTKTLSQIAEGSLVTLQVFNTLGVQTAEVQLILQRAAWLNDLDSQTNPIVEFNATAYQEIGDEFYLNQKQDPSHLGISPYVIYADGTKELVPVDNVNCIIYGLNDLIPSFPGRRQEISIKYYIPQRQKSPIVIEDEKHRYLAVRKNVVILPDNTTYGLKLSVVPYWVQTERLYKLRLLAYTDRRDKILDVTDKVKITNFYGDIYRAEQRVYLDLDLADIFDNIGAMNYRQLSYIKLFPNTEFMKYILKESEEASRAYGIQSAFWNRPIIDYDTTLEQYFIATSVFPTKDDFLDAFYYNAVPPVVGTDSLDPTIPTHFTIRDPFSLNTIISSPIELDQYHQAWNIINSSPSIYIDEFVILEFLEYVDGQYKLIYGVPVDVRQSKTGYQG